MPTISRLQTSRSRWTKTLCLFIVVLAILAVITWGTASMARGVITPVLLSAVAIASGICLYLLIRWPEGEQLPEDHTASVQRLTAILEAAPDAMVIANESGKIVQINRQAEVIFGYDRTELLGSQIEMLMPEDFRSRHETHRAGYHAKPRVRAMGSGLELFARRKDGTQFRVEISLSPLPTNDGNLIFASIRDITERTRADEKFRSLLEAAPDAMIIANGNGEIVLVNQQTEAVFGYGRSELIGQPVERLMPSAFREKHQHYRTGYFSNPKVRAMGSGLELFAVRKDGSQFPVEISLSPLETDEGILVLASVRDITERKKADEKFRSLLEAAPDAMVIANEKGEIVLVNQQTETIFGYTKKELVGGQVELLMPEVFRQSHKAHRARYFDFPKMRAMGTGLELYAVRKNGNQFPVEISLSPITTDEGILVSASVRDITERKNLENQLRMFNKALEEQVKLKTDNLLESYENVRQLAARLEDIREEERSNIAREIHDEIGQQLTGIKMDISWLSKKLVDLQDDQLMERVRDALHLLDSTIKTVRKIATELHPGILDDLGLIAALEWQSQDFEKRFGIRAQFQAMPYEITVAPRIAIGLFRICQESLTNVAKHSEARNVTIMLLQEAHLLTLSIEDDGKGFDIEEKRKKGTLGLIGMKDRALMMGGELKITSAVGQGTSLSLSLHI